MADVTTTPDGGTTIDPNTDGSSGLPSDTAVPTAREAFGQTTDEDFNNDKGLFRGRWNNPQEMADYIKNLEDKHASTVRDQKNTAAQTQEQINATATQAKLDATREAKLVEIAPAFVENGMQLTPEMATELDELGITETEMKLGAYEYKERFDRAYDVVGGKAEYDNMMKWAVDGLSDAEKLAFNKDLGSANISELAIEGLYSRYSKGSNEAPQDTGRFRGQPTANSAVKPYASRAELFQDKAFADSNRANSNDKAKYRARLAATPESVYL